MDEQSERAQSACHGVVTRAQALEAGLTAAQIGWRLRSGKWRQLHKEVYLVGPDEDEGYLTQLSAAVSATGGVASGRSAGVLWQMEGLEGDKSIDVIAPRRSQLPSVNVQVARIDSRLIRTCQGIPVTSPARTLLDLGRRVHPDLVESAMDYCLRKKKTTWAELKRLSAVNAGFGRKGPATLRRLLELRGQPPRYTDSLLETQFFQLMRYAQLPRPRLQYPVIENRKRLGRVDFAWLDADLLVETVGHSAHGVDRAQFKRDARRSTAISRLRRFNVFTFSWDDVQFEQLTVCRTVAEGLRIRWDPTPAVLRDLEAFAARLTAARARADEARASAVSDLNGQPAADPPQEPAAQPVTVSKALADRNRIAPGDEVRQDTRTL
jgi:very-short-patch-repair endonuclease